MYYILKRYIINCLPFFKTIFTFCSGLEPSILIPSRVGTGWELARDQAYLVETRVPSIQSGRTTQKRKKYRKYLYTLLQV